MPSPACLQCKIGLIGTLDHNYFILCINPGKYFNGYYIFPTGKAFHDKMDQAFPLHFCILQAIKNWTVGRPRNKANSQALPEIILIFLPIVRNNYFASQSYNHI